MEFRLKGDDVTGLSRTCRGRHGEVSVVEFGLNEAKPYRHFRPPLSQNIAPRIFTNLLF